MFTWRVRGREQCCAEAESARSSARGEHPAAARPPGTPGTSVPAAETSSATQTHTLTKYTQETK